MIKVVTSITLLALGILAQSASAQILKLSPLSTFGTNGDGAIRPNTVDFLNSSNQLQRGMAWNPVTGHVLVACRTNPASPSVERILVLDGTTGDLTGVTNLDLGSLALGGNPSFFVNLIAVADDGAIYVCNLSNTQIPAQFHLYRWSSETDFQSIVYYSDFDTTFSDAVNRRWGDTLTVRGSGVNTEVLVCSRGTNICILRPTDPSMSTFYPTMLRTDVPAGALGYGVTFGPGNTFWGTAGASANGPLYYMSYDVNAGTATALQSWNATNFPAAVSQLNFLPGSNWLAGLDTRPGADFVRLYSITNLSGAPSLQDRATWVTSANNATFSGALALTTNNILYALDPDNGLMAFTIGDTNSNPLAPSVTLQPIGKTTLIGSNITFSAAADGDVPLSFQWRFKSGFTNGGPTVDIPDATNLTYSITNLQLSNSGNYTFIVTNANGSATSSVVLLSVVSANQAFYESFNYAAGTLLQNQASPAGDLWNLVTGASGGAISNFNLSYPGLPASTGNAFVWPSPGGSTSVSERLATGTNVSGTLFFSFLFRVDNLVGSYTSDTIAGFGEATNSSDTVFDPKINIASNSPGFYQLGVYKGGGTTLGGLGPNVFGVGDTVFIVGNYNFVPDALNDTVNMWLNPDPSTFGAPTPPTPTVGPIGTVSGTDMTQLSTFFFRSTMGGTGIRKVADELRVGYSWADVTPLAPPALIVAKVSTNGVVSWPSFYADSFSLQAAPSVTGPWVSVTNPVVVSGPNNTVTVPLTINTRFFRLLK
jgi:hypothetical protein